ncbi:EamA/RhaT family transporter [Enterobacteriaceae bacterium BIT-l23]|uniref:EamA family transporter n=1 Tax=Jejubacter sp. L23 TaxID=3092086 RepID=UPI001585937B|nr:EamA/RhaT family transporter [Enterobacteriaceae bacterium BIT-l23]
MNNTAYAGVFFGVLFCMISAAFDVYVANITQKLNPAVFIVYCFILSSVVFIVISSRKKGTWNYFLKAKVSFRHLILVNVSVLLNWGGLILSLKYLEPAVVGIVSVACGPALTLVISRYVIKGTSSPTRIEEGIAWIVLVGVIIMLVNSYLGKSGITSTTNNERFIGIVCVVVSAIGTVLYTFISKKLSKNSWKPYEILGFRNILMLIIALVYVVTCKLSFSLSIEMFFIVLALSVIGHIFPVFLIQSSISNLDPMHVSLMLLLLPVFTLLFQFIDSRIQVSYESISAVIFITVLLVVLGINKLQNKNGLRK